MGEFVASSGLVGLLAGWQLRWVLGASAGHVVFRLSAAYACPTHCVCVCVCACVCVLLAVSSAAACGGNCCLGNMWVTIEVWGCK